jgi:CheY-like chemotaxis protein
MKIVKQILIVEDNSDLREVLEIILSEEGYKVESASDGKVALNLIQQVPPDLILLDLNMPVMNGWEFIEAYYQSVPQPTPIFIITAQSLAEVRRRAINFKIARIIGKPFRLGELIVSINKWLQPPPSTSASCQS